MLYLTDTSPKKCQLFTYDMEILFRYLAYLAPTVIIIYPLTPLQSHWTHVVEFLKL